jgi:hypothetical protein
VTRDRDEFLHLICPEDGRGVPMFDDSNALKYHLATTSSRPATPTQMEKRKILLFTRFRPDKGLPATWARPSARISTAYGTNIAQPKVTGRIVAKPLNGLCLGTNHARFARALGACSGYVVDHIVPLKRRGADSLGNMQ